MKKYTLLAQFLLILPLSVFAQEPGVMLGLEYRPEIYYFQRTYLDIGDKVHFDKYWSADIKSGIGTKFELSYGSFGGGVGAFFTTLGFNKNNPDSSDHLFVDGRPYIFDNLKYRATYIELPFCFFYKISKSRVNFKFGLSYSIYWQLRSYIKDVSYYESHIKDEKEISDAKNLLINSSRDNFNSYFPYSELEIKVDKFSFSFKLGFRFHTEKYNDIFMDKPASIVGAFSVNYYLLKDY